MANSHSETWAPAASVDGVPQHVYIVDDDRSVSASICHLLQSVGLTCETFAAPEELIGQLTPPVDGCLIMDVRMPNMSGLEAYEVLKSRGVRLPVLFLTAHQDVPTAIRAMKAGAVDVLLKPCNSQTLIDAVHAALAQNRVQRAAAVALAELRGRAALLTPRERQVMSGVVAGKANKQIAYALGTTEKTVKVHRAEVMRKMAAASLPDLVRSADRLDADAGAPIAPDQ